MVGSSDKNSERLLHGTFYTLYNRLKEDPNKFFNYFRMSEESFHELLYKIKDHVIRADTNMRESISPEEMLAVTLRYLGSGCSFVDLHYTFRIGRSTGSVIVRTVCKAIWSAMQGECLPTPTEETWREIAEGFSSSCNFPNCLGAVDGRHIRIIKPDSSGSLYHNYKHYFSIVLLAVADSNYRFIYVDIGAYGKEADPTILSSSELMKRVQNNTINIPAPDNIVGIHMKMQFAFIGDEAFSLSKHMLRPFSGKHLPMKKRLFNYRLSRARRVVECSFGILSNKWRIFHRPIDVGTCRFCY